jgi:hypothetical protein
MYIDELTLESIREYLSFLRNRMKVIKIGSKKKISKIPNQTIQSNEFEIENHLADCFDSMGYRVPRILYIGLNITFFIGFAKVEITSFSGIGDI